VPERKSQTTTSLTTPKKKRYCASTMKQRAYVQKYSVAHKRRLIDSMTKKKVVGIAIKLLGVAPEQSIFCSRPNRDTMLKVTFSVKHDVHDASCSMYVTGSLPSLGTWSVRYPTYLHTYVLVFLSQIHHSSYACRVICASASLRLLCLLRVSV
jgi:hypothetical protein